MQPSKEQTQAHSSQKLKITLRNKLAGEQKMPPELKLEMETIISFRLKSKSLL